MMYLAEPIRQNQSTWELDGVCEGRCHGVYVASYVNKMYNVKYTVQCN